MVSRSQDKLLYGGVAFGSKERRAIEQVLDRNWWGLSEEGDAFELELAQMMGVKHALFVNSGSAALELGMTASGLKSGCEVIVPACTFPTPVASLLRLGCVPVLADVREGSNCLDPNSLRAAITERTRAILLVYVTGNVSDLDEILSIAAEHDLLIFEDNCLGLGGTWNGRMLGSFGTFSATSTNAAHIISTGEGGVLFTDNAALEAIARSLRDWGRIDPRADRDTKLPVEYSRYTYGQLGYNFRPLELQAAMGRVQLSRLAEFKARRKEHFDTLMARLQRHADKLILPTLSRYADPSWFTFPFVLRPPFRRADLCKVLDEEQIEWRPLLAGNIARQPAFADRVVMRTPLPCADAICEAGLWVSTHPLLPQDATSRIADVIDGFFM